VFYVLVRGRRKLKPVPPAATEQGAGHA
jgi:hypothetical protein